MPRRILSAFWIQKLPKLAKNWGGYVARRIFQMFWRQNLAKNWGVYVYPVACRPRFVGEIVQNDCKTLGRLRAARRMWYGRAGGHHSPGIQMELRRS